MGTFGTAWQREEKRASLEPCDFGNRSCKDCLASNLIADIRNGIARN